MKKQIIYIVFGVLIATLFSSCLESDNETHVPTLKGELAGLAIYIENLEAAGNNVDTTDLGIYYVVLEEGEGDYPQEGDSLEVGYAGYFTDGSLFDASNMYVEDGTYSFRFKNPPMIAGWDSGIEKVNKNSKVQLVIPSEFAYGASGQGIIPPFTTLVFVIKMVEIIPSDEI